jgi:small conductance mechanosensitive channel
MGSLNIIVDSFYQLWTQMVMFVPKFIVAIVIWVIGKYLINLAVSLIKKIDIKGTEVDDYLIGILSKVVFVVGKVLLVLIILDYLGIGRTLVSALANGLTITIAIALGLAFGKALEDDARLIVSKTKKHLGKKPAKK